MTQKPKHKYCDRPVISLGFKGGFVEMYINMPTDLLVMTAAIDAILEEE